MTFDEWTEQVPAQIRDDAVWKVEAYRLGLFLSDLTWIDARKVGKTRQCWSASDQLNRATGNISSNICEGFSRSMPADRARFYEYAFGSVREARDWYFKVRHVLPVKVVTHRIELCTQIARLLNTMILNERRRDVRVTKAGVKR